MPHGRFDKPPETMKIGANGESVEACGPLSWNGDDPNDRPASSLRIKSVEVKQGNTSASKAPNAEIQRGPDEWMVDSIPANGSQTFQAGDAHAKAEVEVFLQNGDTTTEHWNETVKLSL
jgi:hypothetical protein